MKRLDAGVTVELCLALICYNVAQTTTESWYLWDGRDGDQGVDGQRLSGDDNALHERREDYQRRAMLAAEGKWQQNRDAIVTEAILAN